MIPTNWNNITVGMYSELLPTFDIKDLSDLELVDNKIKQLSIIKGISLKEAENCSMKDVQRMSDLINTPLPTKIVKQFKLKGITYRFNMSAHQLNGGGYMGIMDAVASDPYKNLHVTMFNLSTPMKFGIKGWKDYEFKEWDIADRVKDFKDMPMYVAYPIAVFFFELLKKSMGDTKDYSQALMKKMSVMLEDVKVDLLSGDGQ